MALYGFDQPLAGAAVFMYTLRYYLFGLLTLLPFVAVGALIGMCFRSTVSAAIGSVGFWLASVVLSRTPWPYLSLWELQANELLRLLSQSASSLGWFLTVVVAYTALGATGAAFLFARREV